MLCNGYEKRLARAKDIQRMHLGAYLNAHRGKRPPVNIEQMVPLVTDKKKKVELMTAEEYEARKNLKVTWQAPGKN